LRSLHSVQAKVILGRTSELLLATGCLFLVDVADVVPVCCRAGLEVPV